MAIRDDYDFGVLVNEAERMVTDELERALAELADPSICLCQDCVLDMAAFALNASSRYTGFRSSARCTPKRWTRESYAAEVKAAVDAAIDKVHANPGHDLVRICGAIAKRIYRTLGLEYPDRSVRALEDLGRRGPRAALRALSASVLA